MTANASSIAGGDYALATAWTLSYPARRLIAEMSNGEFVHPIATTAADADVPVRDARKILKRFRADGLAKYGPLFDEDDGTPCGSGTWLTPAGLAVRAAILSGEV